jgi:hypothetical protein
MGTRFKDKLVNRLEAGEAGEAAKQIQYIKREDELICIV